MGEPGPEDLGDGSPQIWGTEVPQWGPGAKPRGRSLQKLKQNVIYQTIFNVFLYKIQDLMSTGAELEQYILQTHNSKNLQIQWGFEPP